VEATSIVPSINASTTAGSSQVPHGAFVRNMLSNNADRSTLAPEIPNVLTQDGHTYHCINMTSIKYKVSRQCQGTRKSDSLVDDGANGGVSRSDVRVIANSTLTCDVMGVADHAITNLPLSTVAGLIHTTQGPIIDLFNQYAYLGTGKTVHSCT
jgi:hypothetical protein